MKLLSKCFFALVFMGCSLCLKAGVEPEVSIRSQRGQSFSLHLKDINKETLDIQLSDQFGFVLINEKVKDQDDYLQFYNLKKLATGNYTMRIESERKIILQPIHVNHEKESIDISAKKEIYKPSVKFEYPNLDLNMLHLEEGTVNIKIIDKIGYNLYEDELFTTGSIGKRLKVTTLPAGDYIFEVWTKNYTYEQTFSIGSDNKIIKNLLD